MAMQTEDGRIGSSIVSWLPRGSRSFLCKLISGGKCANAD